MKEQIRALRSFESVELPLDQKPYASDTIERTLFLSLVGTILSLLILGGLAYWATVQYTKTISHTIEVQKLLTELADLRAGLSRSEASHRAYIVTDNPAYIASLDNLAGRVSVFKKNLSQLALPNNVTIPPALLDVLEQRVALRAELLQRIVNLHNRHLDDIRARQNLIDDGAREMAVIEALLTQTEQRLRDAQKGAAAAVAAKGRQIIVAFSALALVTAVFLAFMFQQIRREVRQRKLTQQLLLDRERNLQGILAAAVDGIIVIDSHGIVQSMNHSAERMFGYSANEVVGRNISMLMPEPYHSEHDSYLEHYLKTGEKKIIGLGREVAGRRKDGGVFPMDLAVGETRAGQERRFIGTVRDITRRKETELAQIKLMADLSAANDELRSFSYVVSHDLKAPLRGIGSLADWLKTDYGDKLGDEGNRQIELLIGRVRRMDRLIDGILEYSRAGRPTEQLAAVDTGEALAAAIALIDVPPNIKVNIETPLPRVRAEFTRIQQVFQNLISNAVKHANVPDGEIRIGCTNESDSWHFYVRDNGPGIDARNFERIFQLFQTLVPKDTSESTGVGLAIVKKVVELYGGKVWVESEKGKGASFEFLLPKLPPAKNDKEEKHAQ
jgi:PAS domain S-box-containing protein